MVQENGLRDPREQKGRGIPLQVQIIAAFVDLTLSILVPAGRFFRIVSRVAHSLTYTTQQKWRAKMSPWR